jgi:hypothetical protein
VRTEADFPYQRGLNIHALRGPQKLRAVADRELAGYLLALLDCIEGRPAQQRPARQLRLPQPARWSSCLEVPRCVA